MQQPPRSYGLMICSQEHQNQVENFEKVDYVKILAVTIPPPVPLPLLIIIIIIVVLVVLCTVTNLMLFPETFKGPPSTDRLFDGLFLLWKFVFLIVGIVVGWRWAFNSASTTIKFNPWTPGGFPLTSKIIWRRQSKIPDTMQCMLQITTLMTRVFMLMIYKCIGCTSRFHQSFLSREGDGHCINNEINLVK